LKLFIEPLLKIIGASMQNQLYQHFIIMNKEP